MTQPPRSHQDISSRGAHSNRARVTPLDRVPLLDIGRENSQLENEIAAAISQVTKSGRFVMGPECQQLEQRVARLCNVKHALGCASGSDALLLACMTANVQPGDEVIVPSFTFFATASAVSRLGAEPVFVDILPETFNMDPAAVSAAITPKTKAIIAVHLFGQPADMNAIVQIAKAHNLVVIEDAAQAIGARSGDQPVGSIGDIGCFSFYPTKNLGGFGDGGMLTTNSDEHAHTLGLLRAHGMEPRYYHQLVGVNSRLDTLQAAVLNIKLPYLAAWSEARSANAARYQELLGGSRDIELPRADLRQKHVWNQYTIRVKHGLRDQLREYLSARNVGTEVYYPVPLHLQKCFEDLPRRFALTETERAATEVLSLPIFPHLTAAELETVVAHITDFLASRQTQTRRSAA